MNYNLLEYLDKRYKVYKLFDENFDYNGNDILLNVITMSKTSHPREYVDSNGKIYNSVSLSKYINSLSEKLEKSNDYRRLNILCYASLNSKKGTPMVFIMDERDDDYENESKKTLKSHAKIKAPTTYLNKLEHSVKKMF